MEKTKKQRTINKLLTLMLTFVMVFTGMGIGSWGVSEAWADDTIPTISIQANNKVFEITSNDASVSIKKEVNVSIPVGDGKAEILYVATINNGNKFTLENSTGAGFGGTQVKNVNNENAGAWGKGRKLQSDSDYCTKLRVTEENLKELKLDGTYISGCAEYYFVGVNKWTKIVLLIQVNASAQPADKESLATVINEAKGIISSSPTQYYTSEDRFNGKTVSANGFWNDMKSVLSEAEAIYAKNASKEQVVEISASLSTAIDNLIPTSQINATALFEATQPVYWKNNKIVQEWGVGLSAATEDNCTQASWTAYAEAKAEADAWLEKLFKDKKPTEANCVENKDAVDSCTNNLLSQQQRLVNKTDYEEYYGRYMQCRDEAGELLVQYSPEKLQKDEYSEESWNTYVNAYNALDETYKYKNLGGTKDDYDAYKKFHIRYDDDEQRWIYQTEALITAYNGLKLMAML